MNGIMKNKIRRCIEICKNCEEYNEYSKIYKVDSEGYVVNSSDRKFIPPFHEWKPTFRTCYRDGGTVISAKNYWGNQMVPDDCPYLMEQQLRRWNK